MARFNSQPEDSVDMIHTLNLIDEIVDVCDGDEYQAITELAKLGFVSGLPGVIARAAFITMSEQLDADQ